MIGGRLPDNPLSPFPHVPVCARRFCRDGRATNFGLTPEALAGSSSPVSPPAPPVGGGGAPVSPSGGRVEIPGRLIRALRTPGRPTSC